MAKEMQALVIDDGTKEIPLINQYGKRICAIHIRPADFSILDRLADLEKDYPDIVKPLADIDINPDGTAVYEQAREALGKVRAELINRMNELFDMDEAEDIFRTRSPFSSVEGQFFFYIVLKALGERIAEAVEEEQKLSQERMEPYLSDIQTAPEVANDRATAKGSKDK